MAEITDEMVETGARIQAQQDGHDPDEDYDGVSAVWEFYVPSFRVALSAVAPLIRVAAFREAAAVASDRAKAWAAYRDQGNLRDENLAVSFALIALAEKETTNG